MTHESAEKRYVPASTWFELSDVTLRAVMVMALAAVSASLFLASSGLPEVSVPPLMVLGGAVALGFVLVTLFQRFEVEGLPLIE